MVTAILLLETAQAQTNAVAEALVELEGVSEVHSVAGRVDLVAILRVPTNDALAALVTEKIRLVEGIVRSETLIGFRVYSRHDLERMFGVGMGEW